MLSYKYYLKNIVFRIIMIDTKVLSSLPTSSGVYIFKNAQHGILYVGKAKCIKKRVLSYFHNCEKDWKIKTLIQEHAYVDFIITKTEHEALLLEAQLIKDNQPKFNVLLKNGQPFVYILFTQEELPRIELVRNKKKKGSYFGPFLHKTHARNAYRYVMKTFRLELCSQKIPGGCLNYHIDLCAGNCRDDFDQEGYRFRIQLALNLLKDNYVQSLQTLEQRIKHHTKELAFEKAQQLTEYYKNLEIIFQTLKTKFSEKRYEQDIFLATAPVHRRHQPDFELATQLQELVQTPHPINSVDCFDISHFQSTSIVGSCIRFTDGIPDKNNFRRFMVRSLTQQNDYAALQEIIRRRYKNPADLPDLIVIDGGKGQLHAAQVILQEKPLVSLAKREERLFTDNAPDGILLDVTTKVGAFFIGLRDYAHHFAIQYHRSKRKQNHIR